MLGQNHGVAPAGAATPPIVTSPRIIAIVGAGFSGTSLAIHLARQPWSAPARIILIDPRAELGAGIAYAARDYPYPLNVAAGQMSLDSSRPRDFLDYAQTQGIHAEAGDYLPRQVFGEYLRARLDAARHAAPAHLIYAHRQASALQLRRTHDGGWELWLDDGGNLRADDVVLALGNAPPTELHVLRGIAHTDRYIRDPWSIGALAGQELESVLLVGSGLTMIDAALRLAAIRPRVRHIHVLSRHGWLPQSQVTASAPPIKPDVAGALAQSRGSIRRITHALGAFAREVHAAGGDWREVLALARQHLPNAWRELPDIERARFLRHVRSLWDVHRHRVPAGPLGAVHSLARMGVLHVHAGRLEAVNPGDDAVEVIWRPRGALKSRAWLVDRVINCTGPDPCAKRSQDPLVRSLLANGLIRCDSQSLGIDVAVDGRVIARDGAPVDSLYYIGPWLRARDWEATAVPELREHAARLAGQLAEHANVAHVAPPV
jgi:uncharacterized NAD(P)/FAD-binding protein YdhS